MIDLNRHQEATRVPPGTRVLVQHHVTCFLGVLEENIHVSWCHQVFEEYIYTLTHINYPSSGIRPTRVSTSTRTLHCALIMLMWRRQRERELARDARASGGVGHIEKEPENRAWVSVTIMLANNSKTEEGFIKNSYRQYFLIHVMYRYNTIMWSFKEQFLQIWYSLLLFPAIQKQSRKI